MRRANNCFTALATPSIQETNFRWNNISPDTKISEQAVASNFEFGYAMSRFGGVNWHHDVFNNT